LIIDVLFRSAEFRTSCAQGFRLKAVHPEHAYNSNVDTIRLNRQYAKSRKNWEEPNSRRKLEASHILASNVGLNDGPNSYSKKYLYYINGFQD
jgi:hypothetical protein